MPAQVAATRLDRRARVAAAALARRRRTRARNFSPPPARGRCRDRKDISTGRGNEAPGILYAKYEPKIRGSMAALVLAAIRSDLSVSARVYEAIREAITATNLYEIDEPDLRLDERELAARLGVSRTPIREALVRLEHEQLVTSVPRRGYFIARKSKAELLEIFVRFDGDRIAANLDEYSDANLRFHQRIIDLSGCEALRRTADGILVHVRSIRHRTIGENHRFERSIVDHMHIIEAIEKHDPETAERLVRDHALALGVHVATNDNDL